MGKVSVSSGKESAYWMSLFLGEGRWEDLLLHLCPEMQADEIQCAL